MFPTRNAAMYIKPDSSKQNFQCSICFGKSTELLKCEGPCQKTFCNDCVDRYIFDRRACMFCQDTYRFSCKFFGSNDIKFQCPYDPAHATLGSLEEFTQHCFDCEQIKPEGLKLKDHIQRYQCNQGHRLIFLSQQAAQRVFLGRDFFDAMTKSLCIACKDVTLCRSYCPECSKDTAGPILYCVKCRFLPATKTHCPLGHKFEPRNFLTTASVCDFCGFSSCISSRNPFSDRACNFDICNRCYQRLKETSPLQPLTNQFTISQGPRQVVRPFILSPRMPRDMKYEEEGLFKDDDY